MSSVLDSLAPLTRPRSRRWRTGGPLADRARSRRWRNLRLAGRPSPQVADGLAISGATLVALILSRDLNSSMGQPVWIATFDLAVLVVFRLRGLYGFRLQPSLLDGVAASLAATALAAAAVITFRSVVAPDVDIARETLSLWALVTACLLAARTGTALSDRRAWGRGEAGKTLIVGAGAVGQQTARHLLERPELGLCPVGFLDKEPLPLDIDLCGVPVVGASWDLEAQTAIHEIENVLFTFSTAPHHVYLDLIRRSHQLGLRVLLVPRFFEQITGRVQLEHVGGTALFQVKPVRHRGAAFAVKHLVDRVVAALALVVLSPLMLAIAAAVRLTSPGPLLFRQRRVGHDGREFEMLKFRTMTGSPEVDGEADAAWIAQAIMGDAAREWTGGTPEHVDRRTPVGRLLRKTSLDELPQLINVVRGEMSLVGPRPERTALARSFQRTIYRYDQRYRVKAGITGWAQVQGLRGETSLVDRTEWDNHYIENWTPWFDIKILIMTFTAMFASPRQGD